jgi:hypothetical protein
MYDNIINNINSDLSLEELGNIVKQSLATMYSKLEDEGMYYPNCFVKSVGRYEYDVDICFVDGRSSNTGMSYEEIYWL